MTTQNVQVFIRSTDVGATNPLVIACYPESRQVESDTHGPGMSVYVVPVEAIQQPVLDDPSNVARAPMLVDNWQSISGMTPLMAEASRRVNEAFSLSERLASVHHTMEGVMKYGTDLSKWPLDMRQRKADFDEKWKYVEQINERVRAHAASNPQDLSSDKAWPARPKK
jgi:hypothetical protein